MTAACVVCGGERFAHALTGYDRVTAREADHTYERCQSCSLLRLTPIPPASEIAGFYPADYLPHAPLAGKERERARRREARLVNRLATRLVYAVDRPDRSPRVRRGLSVLGSAVMRDVIEPRGEHRLLDVGCGSGALLRRHRALGWQVQGIELAERAVTACRDAGLQVHAGTLADAGLPAASFDAILLHHVIEHVPDPLDALVRARRLLTPGGILCLVTPNTSAISFRVYGSCWYALDAPRHLHLFDRENLATLARRAGLSVVRIATEASPRIFAESRHYARSQGATLPPGLDARKAAIARSRDAGSSTRTFRRSIRPLLWAAAKTGRGDTLRAWLAPDAAAAEAGASE